MIEEKEHKSEQNIDLTNLVKSVITKVLTAEYKKRHQRIPRGINEEIKIIIEKEIDEL